MNDVLQLCKETAWKIYQQLFGQIVLHAKEIEKEYRGNQSNIAKSMCMCTEPFIHRKT